MANVHLYQPMNMLALPTTLTMTGYSVGEVLDVKFFDGDYFAFIGSFVADTAVLNGTIRAAALDFDLNDNFPNLIIENLNFTFDDNYGFGVILAGNIQTMVTDMLGGRDSIVGTLFSETIDGFGGSDTISAGDGDDHLIGDRGNDVMFGGAGMDVLYGGAGKDTLNGGAGQDSLTGNRSADTFRFDKVSHSPASSAVLPDLIDDFTRPQGDKIDLSHIDANVNVAGNQAFEMIGKNLFTGNAGDAAHRGELRYVVTADGVTLLGDVDGNSVADLAINVASVGLMKVTDFIL